MTTRQTTMAEPVDLGLPLDEPQPRAGCDVCGALAEQRAAARASGDHSKVSDLNVEMRNHHKPKRAAARRTATAS
ncbi:hypothetical protein ACIQ8D_15205 [Streptomyces sp. NPDC096094]|uniref:hypothetical protein n=1 Tax=Streptomyces sp. NPDC096094 TaxID=3366073 RepID=UPI0038232297